MVELRFMAMAIAALIPQAFGQNCAVPVEPLFPAKFAAGYDGKVLMNGLLTPRALIFDNEGNILTTESGGYGVRYVKLSGGEGLDVCVQEQKQLIADDTINHGIALTPDGKTLFVSSQNMIWSWSYDAATGTVSNKKELITDMTQSGYHLSRTLIIPRSNPEVLLVQRGSQENLDHAASVESTARSMIKVFKISDLQALTAPIAYTTGETLAWGIRNTVAVGEHPNGGIWTVDNGVDDMERDGVDIHNTNPCEELNYHGQIDDEASPQRGANHGYPYCHAAWDTSVIPNAAEQGIQVGTPLAIGTSSNDTLCEGTEAPKLCFPSHTAPLDIKFNANGTSGYIAFHGSWNRSPPDGYRVSRIEFNGATGQPIEPSNSTTAAFNIMQNPDNTRCPDGCFRPVNVVFGPKGQMFMTSDNTGEIWVVTGDF